MNTFYGTSSMSEMRNILFHFLVMFSLLSCRKATEVSILAEKEKDSLEQNSKPTKTVIDSIIYKENYKGDYISSDELMNQFELNEDDLQQVLESYHSLKETHPDSTIADPESYTSLVNKWIPLEIHNGDYYMSRYCELQKRWILTDTLLIRFFQDGPATSIILKVEKKNNEYQIETTGGALHFKLIDTERKIYSFSDGGYANNIYVIPVDRIQNFPIMFHECDNLE